MHRSNDRFRHWKLWVATSILTLPLLNGCGTTTAVARGSAGAVAAEEIEQKGAYLKAAWDRQARLDDLAWPLLTAGVQLCGEDVTPRLGIQLLGIDALPADLQSVATQRFGVSERPMVLHVTKNGPAAKAGLKPGDRLVSIDGTPIAVGRKATSTATELMVRAARSGDPVEMAVSRAGEPLTIRIEPVSACSYPVLMQQDDALNAFADGDAVYVTTGMYRFARDDEELQLVIAHEIAHNAEGHADKKMANWGLGTLLDVVAAAYGVNTQGAFGNAMSQVYSQDFEREADYVGMYLLARADIDTSYVAEFWRRMSAEYPQTIKGTYTSSHPATAERWTNIEAAHLEIVNKKQAALPLIPERTRKN